MTTRANILTALVLVAALAAGVQAQLTAEQIDQSVSRGVELLWKTQRPDGGWGDFDSGIPDFGNFFRGFGGGPGRVGRGRDGGGRDGPPRIEDMGTIKFEHGQTMAALLGLAYSGVEVSDKRFQKALDTALAAEVSKNYVLGLRVLALAKVYDRLSTTRQQTARTVITKDVTALAANQNNRGLWYYEKHDRNTDMGSTAMAIAALAESASVMTVKDGSLWKQSLASLMEAQREDGRWNYTQMGGGMMGDMDFGSTTANGVAGLLALRTVVLHGGGCPCRDGKSSAAADTAFQAIERGLAQISKDDAEGMGGGAGMPGAGGQGGNVRRAVRQAEWAFFWARSGSLNGNRLLGDAPWYARMASTVVNRQQDDGGWGETVATGLSLAALSIGREPPLVTKVRLAGASWNTHPDDVAGLVSYVSAQRKEPLRWQAADLESKLADLHESPILYLCIEAAPNLNDEQRKRLREFTDTGGTVVIEPSCGDKAASDWAAKLCTDLWPEWPAAAVSGDHPLMTADQKLGGRRPNVRGLDDGLRLCVLVSEQDLSCLWAQNDPRGNREPLRFGQNLYAYAMDRAILRGKWQTPPPADTRYSSQTLKRGTRDRIAVARIKHSGDWAVGRNYKAWDLLNQGPLGKAGLTVSERDPVVVGQPVPGDVDLLYLTGRQSCGLDAAGAEWLKKNLGGGTFLLVEAALGDARFNESVRAVLKTVGLEIKPLPADAPPLTGAIFDATGYKLDQVRYSTSLDAERKRKEIPALGNTAWPEGQQVVLYGLYAGPRLVGLYSPFDVVFSQTGYHAFGNLGYSAEDARAVATNVLLLTGVRAAAAASVPALPTAPAAPSSTPPAPANGATAAP